MSHAQLPYQKYLPIFPRDQWEHNLGYCGEVSLISAGLYYGQYLSQYDVRDLATGDQLEELNFDNAERAVKKMHLTSESWSDNGTNRIEDFLAWIKQSILSDIPVMIGIYMNGSIFDGLEEDGKADYDHEVPVIGIESHHPLSASHAQYYDDDWIVFSDNGLYTPRPKMPLYLFKYKFKCFQKSRDDASDPHSPPYSLANDRSNYGIKLTGTNAQNPTLPVRVCTSVNNEPHEIVDKSRVRPKPIPFSLSIGVWGMNDGNKYKLYRYDNRSKVPEKEFNKNAKYAAKSWEITTANPAVVEVINSNHVAVYRAVAASAP
jgi:hypothetical protein